MKEVLKKLSLLRSITLVLTGEEACGLNFPLSIVGLSGQVSIRPLIMLMWFTLPSIRLALNKDHVN